MPMLEMVTLWNSYLLVERKGASTKGGLLMPTDTGENIGVITNGAPELVGHTVYFGDEFKQIKIEGKTYLVMKPTNVILDYVE